MSLIYNILLLIGMNKKVKLHIKNNYFKSFNSENVLIRMVCLLFILAALIICLYLLYRAISNALYMYRLKTDFYKMRDLGINVKNYNILYFEEFKKKHIMNFQKLKNSNHTEFKNKNGIGMITDKYVVLDFDTKKGIENADFLIEKIPKDTVCEKTPNGYHYYFENDTGKPVYTYVQLVINDIKYSIDVLGVDHLVITSPTNVNGKDYYWINSIYTHKAAKLSENTWILDLLKNQKPFHRKFNNVNLSLNIKNAFIIIDNLNIETNIRFTLGMIKEYSRKIKLLNGVIYVYDDNFYFLTRGSFSKYKNKKTLIEKLKNIITELKPSCIVDLSIIYSNYFKSEHIFQITSAVIHNDFKNYKNDIEFPDYIQTTNIYKKTKYLINDTITINNYDTTKAITNTNTTITTTYAIHNTSGNNNINKILTGNESIYVTFLLSNYFNIPSVSLGVISSNSDNSEESSNSLNQASRKIINTIFTLF